MFKAFRSITSSYHNKLIISFSILLLISLLTSCTIDPSLMNMYFDDNNQSGQLTMEWEPNDESDLSGYKIYYGTSSGIYEIVIDVGNKTMVTIDGLEPGLTYYISATAYTIFGLESDFSDEIVYTIPI